MGKKTDSIGSNNINPNASITVPLSFLFHFICSLGLALAVWLSKNVYSINLISNPSETLLLIAVVESPIVILLYSLFRRNPEKCSYLKATGRGIVGLPIGGMLMAFGAVILGAPVGTQFLWKTVSWCLVMSLLTVVPAACVFGSSWDDWQRLFAHTKYSFPSVWCFIYMEIGKPAGILEYMICIPAYGAIIGAWLGAFPMPLDWERPWQEWPICVSYGAIAGYLLGTLGNLLFVTLFHKRQHIKGE